MGALLPAVAFFADILVDGAATIPMVATWVLGYIGPLYTGLESTTLDGKPNPRAQGRAADDSGHWYASDGCGKWDLEAFGPEVVADRQASRRALEALPRLRAVAEARRVTGHRFLELMTFCSCVCGLTLCFVMQSFTPRLWNHHPVVCSALCFLYAPQPAALLASLVQPMVEHVRVWISPVPR